MTIVIESFAPYTDTSKLYVCDGEIPFPPKKYLSTGGTIPLDVVRRFRTLLPKTHTIFHDHVPEVIKTSCSGDRNVFQHGISVPRYVSGFQSRAHKQHNHRFSFKYPLNVILYISLNQHAFREYISAWIGSVNDCYILRSVRLEVSVDSFGAHYSLHVH